MSGPSGGGRIYGQHGTRHAPRGSDPGATDEWRNVLTPGTAWNSGTTYSAGDIVDDSDHIFKYQATGSTIATNLAIEPGVTDGWQQFWNEYASIFQNGANADPSDDTPDPVPVRYRISIGPPNYYDEEGDLVYTHHQNEIQADAKDLVIGDTVFTILPEYQHQYDVPYHTHDDFGAYVPCRLLKTGEFIWGRV